MGPGLGSDLACGTAVHERSDTPAGGPQEQRTIDGAFRELGLEPFDPARSERLRKATSPQMRLRRAELDAWHLPTEQTADLVAEALADGASESQVQAALRVVLSLHRQNAPHDARRALASVGSALCRGGRSTPQSMTVAALLDLCLELEALPDLPPELRIAAACAALSGEAATARRAGKAFALHAGLRTARSWQAVMASSAPTVRSMLGWHRRLQPRVAPRMWGYLGISMVLFGLSLAGVGDDAPLPGRRDTPTLDPLERAADQVARRCEANPRPDYCDAAERLVRSVRDHDCLLMEADLKVFAAQASAGASPEPALVDTFAQICRRWCR